MTAMISRRDLAHLTALAGLAFALPGLSACSAGGSADAGLAMSKVPRRTPGTLRSSSLSPFGARVLDVLGTGNLVLSPLSIAVVLAMIDNGAAGATAAEFEKVLGSGVGALNDELNTVLQALASAGSRNGLELTVVNAVWAQKDLSWRQGFLDALATWYAAGVRQVDFKADSAAVVTAINQWADQATKGLIPKIVDTSMITSSTRMALANALHLKGSWAEQFDPKATSRQPFTTAAGTQVQADVMTDQRSVPWAETPDWTAAALPFKGGELAMALLLPRDARAEDLTSLAGADGFATVFAARPQPVQLQIPRWKARTNVRLEGPLTHLGLRSAFDPVRADFSGMTAAERLFLSFVVHEATITVDETGAEAAAVTVGGMDVTSIPVEPKTLRLDRPFYWAIGHVPTSTLLFLGRVDDPTRQE